MSYAGAASLQVAVRERLAGWSELAGVLIADAPPAAAGPQTWVLLGQEEVRDASDGSGAGAEHRLEISVLSREPGFLTAKQVAAGVARALEAAPLELSGGAVAGIWFQKAQARRLDGGALRRIDLTYRIRVDLG